MPDLLTRIFRRRRDDGLSCRELAHSLRTVTQRFESEAGDSSLVSREEPKLAGRNFREAFVRVHTSPTVVGKDAI